MLILGLKGLTFYVTNPEHSRNGSQLLRQEHALSLPMNQNM